MTLARSGLKTDTVSDLGIRGALEMAAKRSRSLPVTAFCLCLDQKPSGQI
jgi:hypothetical protein